MGKMAFNEFTKEVAGKIREFLPERFADASIDLKVVTKNNSQHLTGRTIRTVGSKIAPTVYLEQYFSEYEKGADFAGILEKIAEVRVGADLNRDFDAGFLMDFGSCRDRIVPRLISLEMNRAMLETVPHKEIEDLAVTYHIVMSDLMEGMASTAVTDKVLESWGVSVDDVDAAAVRNLHTIQRSTVRSMQEVLAGMMGADAEDIGDLGMLVCSNEHQMYGASCLLDKAFMAHIVEQYGDDDGCITIIPSSVHEVLIVSNYFDKSMLAGMISEVNLTTVELQDRLSSHPYTYDLENGLRSA